MAEDEQKSLLEGTEELSEALFIHKLLKSRAKEIKALQTSLAQPTGTKMIFQRLPNHMRRRTMSHNVKRLPRRLRQSHLAQMNKSGLPPKVKRPSRKFRRRPKNLMAAYTRRQRQNAWTETHIWHAKRFHMVDKWGFRLAERPCDKSFRACYRASAKHCLIQDVSYLHCLELSGPEGVLIRELGALQNPNLGLSMASKAFRTGKREGTTILFHKNTFPQGAIGEIKFVWAPIDPISANNGPISAINDSVCGIYDLDSSIIDLDSDTDDLTSSTNNLTSKNEPFNDPKRKLWIWAHPSFYQELFDCLTNLFDLKNKTNIELVRVDLNRFRLSGPLAHSVLKNSLQFPNTTKTSNWFENYVKSPNNLKQFDCQTKFWKSLHNIGTASELSPHIVLNLIIIDPRLNLPSKRTKASLEFNAIYTEPEVGDELKFGAIWDTEIRRLASENVKTTSEIVKQRASQLVPDEEISADSPCLPVMLIQQPGNTSDHLGYCSGWDIISPTNWGLALWLSFIMRGARAGGLRESNLLKFEQGLTDPLAPDTQSGATEEKRLTSIYTEKYFKLPPNKRVNYTKLGIVSPFTLPWATLIGEWNNQTLNNFFVLRDRKNLQKLQESLSFNKFENSCLENCLVPVKLTLRKRGKAPRFSVICAPERGDLKKEPKEPLHKDPLQRQRKDIRIAHQKLLKTLKRRRIRAKDSQIEIPKTDQIVETQATKMRQLWLPDPKQIRNSCSRKIIGFVTNGDFCYSTGKSRSVGYIAMAALSAICQEKQKNVVLVRSTNSRQYRIANMEIICN